MRCPECRRQAGSFTTAPLNLRPADELACPNCGAALRVGWWPVAGIGLLAAVVIVTCFWTGIVGGDWILRELGAHPRRVLRLLVRVGIGSTCFAALFAPGMYALWFFGWHARRPPVAEQTHGQPVAAPDRRGA